MERTSREIGFDRMRSLAIVWILVSRISGMLVVSEAAGGKVLKFTWYVANLLDACSRAAVPLLLMALGGILLQKESSASLKEVMRRRVGMLLIPLSVWSVIYLVFRFLWQGVMGENFAPLSALHSILNTPVASHLWLFYLLLALYLILPFLRILVEHAPRRMIWYAVGLWFAYTSVWQALSGLFPELALPSFGNLQVLGGWAGYLLLGWLLATTTRRADVRWTVAGYGVCVLITTVGAALMTRGAGESNLVFYQSYMPNIVLMSAFAFMACRDFDRTTVFTPWMPSLAQATMGMYAISELFALLLTPVIRLIPGILSLIFAPPLLFILSLVSVAFMRQVRGVRLLFMGQNRKG